MRRNAPQCGRQGRARREALDSKVTLCMRRRWEEKEEKKGRRSALPRAESVAQHVLMAELLPAPAERPSSRVDGQQASKEEDTEKKKEQQLQEHNDKAQQPYSHRLFPGAPCRSPARRSASGSSGSRGNGDRKKGGDDGRHDDRDCTTTRGSCGQNVCEEEKKKEKRCCWSSASAPWSDPASALLL